MTECKGRVSNPEATWEQIEIGQDTMPCPLFTVLDEDLCRRCASRKAE